MSCNVPDKNKTVSKPLSYASLATVLQYTNPNKRFELSSRIPCSQTILSVYSSKLDRLVFDHNRLTINDTTYSMGLCRNYYGGMLPKQYRVDNEVGGLPYDLDKFGYRKAESKYTLEDGDIWLETAMDDPYILDVETLEMRQVQFKDKIKKILKRQREQQELPDQKKRNEDEEGMEVDEEQGALEENEDVEMEYVGDEESSDEEEESSSGEEESSEEENGSSGEEMYSDHEIEDKEKPDEIASLEDDESFVNRPDDGYSDLEEEGDGTDDHALRRCNRVIHECETELLPIKWARTNTLPPFSTYFQYSVRSPSGVVNKSTLYHKGSSLQEKIREMYHKHLKVQGRNIFVKTLQIYFNSHILSTPPGLKIRCQELKLMSCFSGSFDALHKIICETSFPLQLLETQLRGDENLSDPHLKFAKVLLVTNFRKLEVQTWFNEAARIENKRVHFVKPWINIEMFPHIVDAWMSVNKEIGTCFSFDIHGQQKLTIVREKVGRAFVGYVTVGLNPHMIKINNMSCLLVSYETVKPDINEKYRYSVVMRVVPPNMSSEDIANTRLQDVQNIKMWTTTTPIY